MNRLFATGSLALFLLFAGRSDAAEITLARLPDGTPYDGITIEGEIAVGDYETFRQLALALPLMPPRIGPVTVNLASPGGNFLEAMRIGRLIRALKCSVDVPMLQNLPLFALKEKKNHTCASACFFYTSRDLRGRAESSEFTGPRCRHKSTS
jgi:hypothetical protein